MTDPTLIQLVQMILGAGAVYGGIRAAITSIMRDLLRHEKQIEQVTERFNNHLATEHNRRRSDSNG